MLGVYLDCTAFDRFFQWCQCFFFNLVVIISAHHWTWEAHDLWLCWVDDLSALTFRNSHFNFLTRKHWTLRCDDKIRPILDLKQLTWSVLVHLDDQVVICRSDCFVEFKVKHFWTRSISLSQVLYLVSIHRALEDRLESNILKEGLKTWACFKNVKHFQRLFKLIFAFILYSFVELWLKTLLNFA